MRGTRGGPVHHVPVGAVVPQLLAATLLPPIPDVYLDRNQKEAAITFIAALPVPTRYRRHWLTRWILYTGATVSSEDYARAAGVFLSPRL